MIKTDALTKRYGDLTAVDSLTFAVEPGEVLGFLGPNGAGKSTTMKMIAGFVAPTSGSASVCGFDVEAEPIKAKASLGYLPEGAPAYGEMTPHRFLDFIADLRGLSGQNRKSRLDEVIGLLHLEGVLEQSIETLSKGFKRRVGLAQAVVHDPKVLIMDEPTDGLDPNQKHEVRSLINNMAADKLIVISTHILEEVDAVCNRAIIIADGRVLVDATPGELAERSRYHNAVRVKLNGSTAPQEVRGQLEKLPGATGAELNDDGDVVTVFPKSGASLLHEVNQLLTQKRWEIDQLQVESGRLDDVFRDITGGVSK
ncbi:MAG: ABC transporter ATP-binding protein [Gammaproteobacteria bacterium]